MKVARTVSALRRALSVEGSAGAVVGLVPTMGALHAGHRSLLQLARRNCDVVVASIFVNPLQFGPGEDLERYPRDEEGDLALARGAGVDIVFAPARAEMYRPGDSTVVTVGSLTTILEGAARPGHFDGVATVVAKLFLQTRADVAFFGQKDAQQIAVVKRMSRDLSFPVEIRVGATVRDHDGLALSSRNAYLSEDERLRATSLYRALAAGAKELESGRSREEAEASMIRTLVTGGVRIDYARSVDPDTFEPASPGRPVLLVVAGWVGATRLIDNLLVENNGPGRWE